MKNPFVAAALKAVINAQMARKGAVMAFNLGYIEAMSGKEFAEANARKARRTSQRTVAQDKRDARKARNIRRSK